MKEIQRTYADDNEKMQQELMNFYRENNVSPFRSCVWMLPGAIIPGIPAWGFDRQQTLYEWVAGTAVIVEPRGSGGAVR